MIQNPTTAGVVHPPITEASGLGAFAEGTGGLVRIEGDDVDGIVADYDTECRVHGTYSGAKTTSSFGPL